MPVRLPAGERGHGQRHAVSGCRPRRPALPHTQLRPCPQGAAGSGAPTQHSPRFLPLLRTAAGPPWPHRAEGAWCVRRASRQDGAEGGWGNRQRGVDSPHRPPDQRRECGRAAAARAAWERRRPPESASPWGTPSPPGPPPRLLRLACPEPPPPAPSCQESPGNPPSPQGRGVSGPSSARPANLTRAQSRGHAAPTLVPVTRRLACGCRPDLTHAPPPTPPGGPAEAGGLDAPPLEARSAADQLSEPQPPV